MEEPASQLESIHAKYFGMPGQRSQMDFFASGFLQTSDAGIHRSTTLFLFFRKTNVFSTTRKRRVRTGGFCLWGWNGSKCGQKRENSWDA